MHKKMFCDLVRSKVTPQEVIGKLTETRDWRSDQLIVVRERESCLHGEGADDYILHVEDACSGHVGLG
jgi:hypothetical protein